MKILVTGSADKLGKVTVELVTGLDHQVTGVDSVVSPTTHVVADVCDQGLMTELTRGVDAVIHMAALHGRHMDLKYPREDFLRTNIGGTLNLLNACAKNGVGKFLFTSTTSIYGHSLFDDR